MAICDEHGAGFHPSSCCCLCGQKISCSTSVQTICVRLSDERTISARHVAKICVPSSATICAPGSATASAHHRAPSFYRLLTDWIFLQQPLESSV